MIGRLIVASAVIMGGLYALLWAISFTPFFNKRRVAGIAKRSFLLIIAGVATALVMAFFITVEKL